MDLDSLLNPLEESQVIEATTDEEICQAVLAAHSAQENGPSNGGDNDVEDNTPAEPCPTYHKVFQVASVINRYAAHVDSPLACKLEEVLASLGCQM